MPRRHSIAAYVRHLNRHRRKYAEAEDRYNREQTFEQYKYFYQFLSMAVSYEDRGGGFRFGLMSRGQERKFDEAYDISRVTIETPARDITLILTTYIVCYPLSHFSLFNT